VGHWITAAAFAGMAGAWALLISVTFVLVAAGRPRRGAGWRGVGARACLLPV
jgi:hypothetical protein